MTADPRIAELEQRLARLRAQVERLADDVAARMDALGVQGLYRAAAGIQERAHARPRPEAAVRRLDALTDRVQSEADRRLGG